MKKIFFTLTAISLISFLNAQSFEKGNRNVDVNLGLGIFNTSVKDNQSTADTASKGKAGAVVLAPSMEWAVGKRISIGGALVYSSYLSQKDSLGQKPKAKGLDGVFIFNFHFIKSKRVDMFTGIKLGLAGFRLNPDDGTGNIYGSMGSAFDFHIAGRFYVSDKIGIIANLGFPSYTFKKFGDNLTDTFTLKFKGFYIGTGVAIKLGGKQSASSTAGGK
ncbi:MAG: hypothetical protein HY063_06005 [Bacteroidetes bacterium]|nr:hypothetical protein [Bacteroidota bacterium]